MPHLTNPQEELTRALAWLVQWFGYLNRGDSRRLQAQIKEALLRQIVPDIPNRNATEYNHICPAGHATHENNVGWLDNFRQGTNLQQKFLLGRDDMGQVIDDRYITGPRKRKIYTQMMNQTFHTWLGDRHTSILLVTQRKGAERYQASSTVTNILMLEIINRLGMYPVLAFYSSYRIWPWEYNDDQYDPAGVMFHSLNYQLMHYICIRRLNVAFGPLLNALGPIVSKNNVDQQASLFSRLLKMLRDAKVKTVFVIIDLMNLMTVGDEHFRADRSNLHRGLRRIKAKAEDINGMRIRILITRPYGDRLPVESPNFQLTAPEDLDFLT